MASPNGMTENDLGFLHLVEKIIVPIIIASVIGLATWMNNISAAQAELAERSKYENQVQLENRQQIAKSRAKQEQMLESLHQTEKAVVQVKTNQANIERDIEEIKNIVKSISEKMHSHQNGNGNGN